MSGSPRAVWTAPGQRPARLAAIADYLRSDPAWRDRFRFNAFACRPEMLNGHGVLEPLGDLEVLQVQEQLQNSGFRGAKKETVRDALTLVCSEATYHPVRDWLERLKWDRVPRLNHWLVDCLGCVDSEYIRAIGRMFLVAMVARIMQPGCKADYMLILEGPQGAQKSEVCRVLAGDIYFAHMPPNIDRDPVRTSMALRGKWLLEVSELEGFSRASIEGLKAFLTRQVETFTPKYARGEVAEPRQCLFIGTTNRDQYLSDSTGGRRFWPVHRGEIDAARLAGMRGQLFAEAKAAFDAGEQAWPDAGFEEQHIKPEQEARRSIEPWVALIEPWLRGAMPGQHGKPQNVTLVKVWQECLEGKTDKWARAEQLRVAEALRELGWEPGKRTGKVQFWVESLP